jgi:hypothetical protein
MKLIATLNKYVYAWSIQINDVKFNLSWHIKPIKNKFKVIASL